MVEILLIALAGAGCTEYGYTVAKQTDYFEQNRRNTVDILLVVDNSCSMVEEQAKLGTSFDSFIQYFNGVDVDWRIGVTTTDMDDERFQGRLVGGDDEIVLSAPSGTVIDRVAWDRDWPVGHGVALSLDPSELSASGNDVQEAWCPATAPFGDGDLGTPGQPNPSCGARLPRPDTGGSDTGASGGSDTGASGGSDTGTGGALRSPRSGEVLASEFMPDPGAVPDDLGEWVEFTSVASEDLSLEGCTISDDGRNSWTFPAGATIPAGGRVVVARSADRSVNGGLPADFATGPDMTLNDPVVILAPDTQGAAEIFAEDVALGTSGSGIEMGLEAARSALSEPLLSGENRSFLREDASLSLIVVSDEDDFSPYDAWSYLRFFTELKGEEAYRDHGLMNISAVVGSRPPPYQGQPSCSSDSGYATYGRRYVELAGRSGGLVESICDEDFSPLAAELGLTLSGLSLDFELSARPDVDTLEVSLYRTRDASSFERTLEQGTDYDYVPERNSLHFQEDQVPPSQWWIEATYDVLATGATQDGGSR